jgi:toxin ParE1/3/4
MRRARIHPEADRELYAAAAWYDAQREGLGYELLEEYQWVLARARRKPATGALVARVPKRFEIRRYLFHRFPYALYIAPFDGVLTVFAVAHTSRRPRYWLRRLPR